MTYHHPVILISQVNQRASDCVISALDSVKDSYSLAIIAYMFAKMKDSENYGDTMARLEEMAVNIGQ